MGRRQWLLCLSAGVVLAGCAPQPDAGGQPPASSARAFTWTAAPSLANIPDQPVTGMLGDQPFDVASVLLEPGFHQWRLVCSATAPENPFDPLLEAQKLVVELTAEPRKGAMFQRSMDWGGGFWQVEDPLQPPQLTAWNGNNAWVVEFTSWQVKPYDTEGPTEQTAGTADGRLAVVYQGAEGLKDAWVAGTFTDAPVRYLGPPPWKNP